MAITIMPFIVGPTINSKRLLIEDMTKKKMKITIRLLTGGYILTANRYHIHQVKNWQRKLRYGWKSG